MYRKNARGLICRLLASEQLGSFPAVQKPNSGSPGAVMYTFHRKSI